MKITKSQLRTIILEEYRDVCSEVNRKKKRKALRHKTETEKKREKPWEVFPGYDDRNGGLKQLAHGITEDDLVQLGSGEPLELRKIRDEEEEEEIEEACLGNPWRKRDGTWGSEKNHAVITHGYAGDNTSTDCDHGKWKSGKGSTHHKCGRDPSGKKHSYVCSTGKLRENLVAVRGKSFISLDLLGEIIQSERRALKENQAQELAARCKQLGFTTSQEAFKNLVQTINTLHKSMKGELNKPEKG
tara:strand:+ start:165 stop:896 length:732 start_codon:yes stop_codon:yes gene_type:complete